MCLACSALDGMSAVEERLLPSRTEWVWSELELLRRAYNFAAHPYFSAWRESTVTRRDLQVLAGEHDRVVSATSTAAQHVAGEAPGALRATLRRVAADAVADLERWRAFSAATGWPSTTTWHYLDPLTETLACARAVAGPANGTAGERVAALWATTMVRSALVAIDAGALLAPLGVTGNGAAWFTRDLATEENVLVLGSALEWVLTAHAPHALLKAARAVFVAYASFFDRLDDERVAGALSGVAA
jgi:hypothetical protein